MMLFFVDEPYVSDFLKSTLRDYGFPVVNTEAAQKLALLPETNLVSEAEAIKIVREADDPVIYTTSENSIGWIAKNLPFSDYPERIERFKNKAKFRELTRSICPGFFFKEVRYSELGSISIEGFPTPFIIKPTVGFFSMGVHKVTGRKDWEETVHAIDREIDAIRGLYPDEVLDISSFLIEECIDGNEFAVDAYFNAGGEPVILDILNHPFASAADVSDRVYMTSREIIEGNLEEFTTFVGEIGRLAEVRNFPVHIELRRDSRGRLLPIEVNPMRFGGWCSTPDLAYMAYGINPYLYYASQQKPDWPERLKGKEGKLFSVIVLDNSTGKSAGEISAFDYEKVTAKFEKPIEMRKIDYHRYPVFGFLFAETRADHFDELKYILNSDLKEFVTQKY
jgi:hypothetical protein